jgi:hypothetical protein
MSSLAARRAGQLAAISPSRAAIRRKITRLDAGTTVSVMPCCFSDETRATPIPVPTTVPPQLGQPGIIQAPDVQATHETLPRRRPVQARHALHQRRLSRTRRAHDGREPAALEAHTHPGQGMHRGLSSTVRLAQVDRMRSRDGRVAVGQCARFWRNRFTHHILPAILT